MFTVTFLGDLYPGEYYQQRLERVGGANLLKTKGYRYSFDRIHGLIRDQDALVANLETPLTDAARSPFLGEKKYLHYGDIRETPQLLDNYGIRQVSLANNHVLDYGVAGLEQTLAVLGSHGIGAFGAGLSAAAAAEPMVLQKKPGDAVRIVVAAGFEYREEYERRYNYYASAFRAGGVRMLNVGAGVNGWTAGTAAAQLQALREANPDAYLIAFPHWGKNYAWKTAGQTAMAEAMIDAGADLIIGHGAHALQEIDEYKGKWIVYSVGNSVFNSPGRYAKMGSVRASLVARLSVEARGGLRPAVTVRLYPILSDNLLTGYQPRPLGYDEVVAVREALRSLNSTRVNVEKTLEIEKDPRGYCFRLG